MKRRAVCIGINEYPRKEHRLEGCVNDAHGVADMLVDLYGFDRADITMVLDRQATAQRMLDELERLVDGLARGDFGVFSYAGHGTYVAGDENGDEVYDEALCPWDMEQTLVIDDQLRERLNRLKVGTKMAVILDSCFSGSGTRLAPIGLNRRRSRSVRPSDLGLREIDIDNARPRSTTTDQSGMREILLSGARDNQESADDFIDGQFGGALTTYMVKHLRARKGRVSWTRLHSHLVEELDLQGYSQVPQLEGRAGRRRERALASLPPTAGRQ